MAARKQQRVGLSDMDKSLGRVHGPAKRLTWIVLVYYCTRTGGNIMSYGYGAGGLIMLILLILLLTGRL